MTETSFENTPAISPDSYLPGEDDPSLPIRDGHPAPEPLRCNDGEKVPAYTLEHPDRIGTHKTDNPFLSPDEYDRNVSSGRLGLSRMIGEVLATFNALRKFYRKAKECQLHKEQNSFKKLAEKSYTSAWTGLGLSIGFSSATLGTSVWQTKQVLSDIKSLRNRIEQIDFDRFVSDPAYRSRTIKKIERKSDDVLDAFNKWKASHPEPFDQYGPETLEGVKDGQRLNAAIQEQEQIDAMLLQNKASQAQLVATGIGSVQAMGQGTNQTLTQTIEGDKSMINAEQKEAEYRRSDLADAYRTVADHIKSVLEANNAISTGRSQLSSDLAGRAF